MSEADPGGGVPGVRTPPPFHPTQKKLKEKKKKKKKKRQKKRDRENEK